MGDGFWEDERESPLDANLLAMLQQLHATWYIFHFSSFPIGPFYSFPQFIYVK